MAKRRVSEQSLNFDSMTDLITNLAGGLLLLVLLLLGLTRPAASQSRPLAPPPTPGGRDVAGPIPILPIDKQVQLLRGRLKALEREIEKLDEPLKRAQEEARRLQEELSKYQPPGRQPAVKVADARPKTFEYRPPMAHLTDQKASILIVCQDRRVSLADLTIDKEHYDVPEGVRVGDRLVARDSDFDAIRRSSSPQLLGLVRKGGHEGTTLDEVSRPESALSRALGRLDPKTVYLQFSVYPDSFEVFREVRLITQDRGFDYNWIPQLPGDEIKVVEGGGKGTIF